MNSPNFLRTALAIGLPLAVLGTIILAINYIQEQQIIRQGANEPQVQLAESIAAQIGAGIPPQAIVGTGATPLELLQTPYILIYDSQGHIIAGNASLNGQAPALPAGVLGGHKDGFATGDNRITWQPAANLRQALVVSPFTQGTTTGYVVVGRSLRETENQEQALGQRALLGWIGAMVAVVISALIGAWLLRKREA